LRDLVRAREAAKKDQLRARHRVKKLLLRHGRKPAKTLPSWGAAYMAWLQGVKFKEYGTQQTMVDYLREVQQAGERIERLEQSIDVALSMASPETQELTAALQALKGVAKLTAVTIAAEVGQMSRFKNATQLMSYAGVVPSEHSSGGTERRGGITKAGNAHLRRVLIESSWAYRHRPAVGRPLRKRQEGLSKDIRDVGFKAQHRLHNRYIRMLAGGKPPPKIITAIARELLGFVWDIGLKAEAASRQQTATA